VGGYYEAGMTVPADVTLLWSDDNNGNLQRLPIASEQSRSGGAGVYYHFDYVGSPRNYKWINSIQLSKTWEQMRHAYAKNARQIWIVNVGDLKALACYPPVLFETFVAKANIFRLFSRNCPSTISWTWHMTCQSSRLQIVLILGLKLGRRVTLVLR
jgi:hypothetical protein